MAPLDWGLGHAARCVPIIRELIKNDAVPVIAAGGQPLSFLQKEFPGIESVHLEGYNISYPESTGNMVFTMAFQLPKIAAKIKEEKMHLENIIKEKKINGVISDQRFGLSSEKVPCVFITHQTMIKAPLFENLLYKINKSFIDKFTYCWIPDNKDSENLSGDLSHQFPLPLNAKFIGPLSRFENNNQSSLVNETEKNATRETPAQIFKYEVMGIISGPEPQRSIFENIIMVELKNSGLNSVVVKGQANMDEHYHDGKIEIHSHLETNQMEEKIHSSRIVLARSGYSTLMDLAKLKKKAILIPTPGQTEQEYLAGFHFKKNHFFSVTQKNFSMELALKAAENFTGISFNFSGPSLNQTIMEFINLC